jgi:hypothetical protein
VPLVLVVVVTAVHAHRHGSKSLVKLKDVMGFRVVVFEHEVLRFRRDGVSIMSLRPRRFLAIVDQTQVKWTVPVTCRGVYDIAADRPTHAAWDRLASVCHVPTQKRPDVHLRELAAEGIDDLSVAIERHRWQALHTVLFGQLGIRLHV